MGSMPDNQDHVISHQKTRQLQSMSQLSTTCIIETINLLRMSQDNSYYCIKPHYLLSWSHAISCHGATPSPIIAPRHILSMSHNISNHNKPHHLQSLTTSCSVIEPRHFLSFSLCHLLSLSHPIS